jgi:PAS domain S-box-containing protein
LTMTSRIGRRFFFSSFLGKLFLLTLPALLLTQHIAHAAPSPPAKKVLLLYSYQALAPGTLEWDGAIRRALQDTEGQPIEFYTEFLDLSQFPDESYIHGFLNLLQIKYGRQKIDLLIPLGDLAFSFLKTHGNALFPGSPMVFCAVAKQQVEALKPPPNCTGVVAWVDVQGTLAAATKLQPEARRVAVVGGTSKTDRAFQQIAREALRPYEGQLEVTFLTDLPLAEVLQRLSSLPSQTLVIYLSILRDSTGQAFVPWEVPGRVAQAANAPVYGLWENLLGQGIVGGHLMSFKEQGRLAGEMGRRVLNGEKPEDIPVVWQGANFYEFDWRQLKRWGLKERDLPPGSLVRFKEPSLWESYKREIVGTATAFCLLSLLTIGLLINLARRRRVERFLAMRLEFEMLLAELSAQFVAVEANEVAREIDLGIKRLVEFLGVDRGRLWQFSEYQEEFVPTHFWAAPGFAPPPPSPVREQFPWIRSQLLQGKPVAFSRPGDMPEEARLDRENLLAAGIKSALCIPLAVGGKFMGALTLSTLRAHKIWPAGLAQEVWPIGEILANALRRAQADMELREAELKYRIVADFTHDWEYWKNLDGSLRYVSPSCERISGYRPEEFIRRPDLLREIILPEDRDLWDSHDCDALENPGAREGQFRVMRPDGAVRWIDHTCQPVTDDGGKFIGIRGSNRDITERKEAEIQEQQHREDLARVGRVATLGELTGSLAHEIIQPLMAIMNNSQAARRLLDNPDPDLGEVKEILEDITRGSERASNIIQQLRRHLKPGLPELTQLDLNDLVQSLIPLVSRQAAINHIKLMCELTKGLPPIAGNRIQLEQVILNLLVNSIEAINGMADGPREIVLQTEREDDHTLRVSVRDSGPGVKPEDLKLLFDPFFTTKKEGMGLGLSISRSIIKAHRGRLWAAPNPGGGSALHITLPVSQEER